MSDGALDTKARYGRMPTIRRAAGASERVGLAEKLARSVSSAIKPHLQKLYARTSDLEQRLAALEASQTKSLADSYRGTFLTGTKYARGDLLTHGGSLFLCMRDTSSKPETDDSWRLIVKRGAHAK